MTTISFNIGKSITSIQKTEHFLDIILFIYRRNNYEGAATTQWRNKINVALLSEKIGQNGNIILYCLRYNNYKLIE